MHRQIIKLPTTNPSQNNNILPSLKNLLNHYLYSLNNIYGSGYFLSFLLSSHQHLITPTQSSSNYILMNKIFLYEKKRNIEEG